VITRSTPAPAKGYGSSLKSPRQVQIFRLYFTFISRTASKTLLKIDSVGVPRNYHAEGSGLQFHRYARALRIFSLASSGTSLHSVEIFWEQ